MTRVQRAVQAVLDELVGAGVERGLQVAAYHHGELVVNAWTGVADPATGREVDGDTLFTLFSCGKGVLATAIHLLVERGMLDYDSPIAHYWPEFAANGKAGVTVRHALTHSAGIPQQPMGVAVEDWEGMCRAIADLTPLWEPGTATGYHATTFGYILGEVAHRADGRPIGQIVAEEIAKPLGVPLYFGLPDALAPRVATLEAAASLANLPDPPPDSLIARTLPGMKAFAEQYNRPEVRRAVIPARGGIATAQALAAHYAALMEGETQLLPADRLWLGTRLQTDSEDKVTGGQPRKGLGYFLGGSGSPMGGRITAFGHPGFGGSLGFADPEAGLAFALLKNRLGFAAPGQDAAGQVAYVIRDVLGIPEG